MNARGNAKAGPGKHLTKQQRFFAMGFPGFAFIVIFLFLPIISIIVISFWRTEVYEIYPDWNLNNYRDIFFAKTYLLFFLRSFITAVLVTLACLIYGWPVAFFIARYGGRYRLLMILALAAPFFTGVILRVSALQGILGPVGVLNMTLMTFGLSPIEAIMFSKVATGIGLFYLYVPFMVTAIYLSLLNFDFELLEVAMINGAKPWRAFVEVAWPLNWMGTAIGILIVFVPTMGASITPTFLGGPNGALFASVLGKQFGETGTWALGSAMGVVLFTATTLAVLVIWKTVNLQKSGFTGKTQ